MSDVDEIIKTISKAVDEFTGSSIAKQAVIYKKIIELIKDLQIRNDSLLNNIKNLKIISSLKSKIQRLIVDQKYKQDVTTFAQAYFVIADLNNQYFAKFNEKFTPKETLKIVTKNAVEAALIDLLDVGVEIQIIDPIRQILLKNIHAGGSYSDLTNLLRDLIITNNKSTGILENYVRTYAVTSLNQFSRQYNKTIADDLGLEWYLYTGSLLTTSREFCVKAVAKKYIHQSEFEALLTGNFGELGKVHVSRTTGLPPGLMPGTNPENFQQRAGGWQCPHQVIAVDDSIIPQNIQNEVYISTAYHAWALRNGKKIIKAA